MIQRYEHEWESMDYSEMFLNKNGSYVKYDDHVKEIAKLESENKQLREELEKIINIKYPWRCNGR